VNNAHRFALLSLFLCPLMALPALGRREGNTALQEERIIELQSHSVQSALEQDAEPLSVAVLASGRVRLVGTSLFPELVISGLEWEWYVERDEVYKLADLQHRVVTVEGTETVIQLFWANGRSAGERRTLRDIAIIDVD
jgi:hypothetical protein